MRKRRFALESRLNLLTAVGPSHTVRRARSNARLRSVASRRRREFAEVMWREAAAELGVQMRELAPPFWEFQRGDDVIRLRGDTTPFVGVVSREIASNKPLAYQLLADAGLPIPMQEMVDVRNVRGAAMALERLGVPCVVKPVGGGGGAGVTGQVRTPSQLRKALTLAGRFARQAIIEHQVAGDTYRVLVLDGEVIDIIRRSRPTLTGDGRSTIEQLMFAEFDRRIGTEGPAGIKPFVADLDCLFALAQTPYGLRDVVPEGVAVTVKSATNFNGPSQNLTVARPYPESLAAAAVLATAALGLRLGGVDIIAEDPNAAFAEAGSVVLEVNPIPGLVHHYNVAEPERAVRVAVPILNALLESAVSHSRHQA